MPQSQPDIIELLEAAQQSAVHLRTRDQYGITDELREFTEWRRTGTRTPDPASPSWAPWLGAVSRAAARGVAVRRAHVVSEPVTEYVRFEHAAAAARMQAGEEIRWLARADAADILLPATDLWIVDGTSVLLEHFTGDGNRAVPHTEFRTEPHLVKQYGDAVDAVWERALPHHRYPLR